MFLIIDPDILIAPISMEGAVDRQEYLTKDTDWIDKSTQESFSVGTWLSAQAPLGRLPLYQRKGPEVTWQTMMKFKFVLIVNDSMALYQNRLITKIIIESRFIIQ